MILCAVLLWCTRILGKRNKGRRQRSKSYVTHETSRRPWLPFIESSNNNTFNKHAPLTQFTEKGVIHYKWFEVCISSSSILPPAHMTATTFITQLTQHAAHTSHIQTLMHNSYNPYNSIQLNIIHVSMYNTSVQPTHSLYVLLLLLSSSSVVPPSLLSINNYFSGKFDWKSWCFVLNPFYSSTTTSWSCQSVWN